MNRESASMWEMAVVANSYTLSNPNTYSDNKRESKRNVSQEGQPPVGNRTWHFSNARQTNTTVSPTGSTGFRDVLCHPEHNAFDWWNTEF